MKPQVIKKIKADEVSKPLAKMAAKSKIKPSAKAASKSTSNPVLLELAANLKRYRIASNKSQVELAFDAELDRTYLSLMERAMANPSVNTLAAVCYCLKITLPQLFENITYTLKPTAANGELRRKNQASHDKPKPLGNRRSALR
jgi:transcriptional regulator with XRE-family HTH domain